MDQIILKYLMGELTTSEEQQKLSAWLEEDSMNHVVLEKFEHHWKTKKPDLSDQRNEVLGRIKSEINGESLTSSKAKFKVPANLLKYAAILFVVFLGTYLTYQITEKDQLSTQIKYIEKTSLAGQKINLKLPDGSTVKLNAESKLIVPERFSDKRREVELVGEAFFDVAKNVNKPFIIKMNDFTVEVKGTSFNVRSYPDEDSKIVAVRSGVVEVSSNLMGRSVEIVKDEMSVISTLNNTLVINQVKDSDLIFGWVDQNLVFKNQSLPEVLRKLEKWYGVSVENKSNRTMQKLYTAKHEDNPTLQQVMESVAFVFEIEFEIKGNDLIIK